MLLRRVLLCPNFDHFPADWSMCIAVCDTLSFGWGRAVCDRAFGVRPSFGRARFLHCCTVCRLGLQVIILCFRVRIPDTYHKCWRCVLVLLLLPARTMPTIITSILVNNGAPFFIFMPNETRTPKKRHNEEQPHLFHLVAGISRAAVLIVQLGAWRAAPLMERWFYHEASTCQSVSEIRCPLWVGPRDPKCSTQHSSTYVRVRNGT